MTETFAGPVVPAAEERARLKEGVHIERSSGTRARLTKAVIVAAAAKADRERRRRKWVQPAQARQGAGSWPDHDAFPFRRRRWSRL